MKISHCCLQWEDENGKCIWERKKKMYIIAGLGNPTKEYEGTRHNVGFDVIDRLSERYNIDVTMEKHRALIGKGMIAGQKVILVKPQTYMNLSEIGRASCRERV